MVGELGGKVPNDVAGDGVAGLNADDGDDDGVLEFVPGASIEADGAVEVVLKADDPDSDGVVEVEVLGFGVEDGEDTDGDPGDVEFDDP